MELCLPLESFSGSRTLSSCVWNLRVFPEDARGCHCPFIWCLPPCTSPKLPVSCIEPGLAIRFLYDIIHVLMPFSQIIPPSPSPTESKRLFYTSVSLLLSHIQGCRYHLSKFHIYALVYCIGVFFLAYLTLYNRLKIHPPH